MQETYSNMLNYVHYTSSRTQEGIMELRSHLMYRMAARMLLTTPQS